MAKIKFENGVIVNFDGNPTAQDVEEVARRLNITKKTPPQELNAPSGFRGFAEKTSGRGTQLAKGVSEFAFGTTIGLTKKFGRTIEESARSLGGQKVPIREGFDVLGRGKTPTVGEAAGALLETTPLGLGKGVAKGIAKVVKTPLTKAAEKLFQSALKPRDVKKGGKVITKAEDIVKIGLEERVWLTKGGVEKVGRKINNLSRQLGEAIDAGKAKGAQVSTAGLKNFTDEAKGFFEKQADVEGARKAVKKIDDLTKSFIKKHGDFIPIEEAQEIKVATMQNIKRYYNTLSSAEIEGTKQLVRGLKEGIVESAPAVKDINARLSNLFKFDQALSKASTRIGNLNLLGLGAKGGAVVGGAKGAIVGKLLDLADAPAIKGGTAILINDLTRGAGAGIEKGRVPVSLVIANLLKLFREE